MKCTSVSCSSCNPMPVSDDLVLLKRQHFQAWWLSCAVNVRLMVLRLIRKFQILFSYYVMILLWESWRWSSRPLDHSISSLWLLSNFRFMLFLSLASYISCEKQKAVVSSMMIEMVSYLGKTLLKPYWHMLQRPLVTFHQETDKTLLDLQRY